MKIHLQYISEGTSSKDKVALLLKAQKIQTNKKLDVEIGFIRDVTLSDKDILVIDVWILPNGMYAGDIMRIVRNYGEPYAYCFE